MRNIREADERIFMKIAIKLDGAEVEEDIHQPRKLQREIEGGASL